MTTERVLEKALKRFTEINASGRLLADMALQDGKVELAKEILLNTEKQKQPYKMVVNAAKEAILEENKKK